MPGYGFKVVYADSQLLAEAGFASVSCFPFILDSEPGYARFPNQFLLDRGLGFWDIKGRGNVRNPSPPSRVSMRNFAYRLANALEWAEARGLDLMMVDYTADLIGRYQQEMLAGAWSARGQPLAPETVNSRVQVALEFQMWAADKGLRPELCIPVYSTSFIPGGYSYSRAHERISLQSRKGKIKIIRRSLRFPSISEINEWRNRIYERPNSGVTEGLIVDLILNTAIRREEAACWRVDTLPMDMNSWRIANPDQPESVQSILVDIKYGTKGKEYGIDEFGDKIGPEGTIHVPKWLALQIHEYRSNERLLSLKNLLKSSQSQYIQRRLLNQSVHLFVNPLSGKRYTGEQIYNFWTRAKGPEGWSPHRARNWWACSYLETRMKQHTSLIHKILEIPHAFKNETLLLALRDTAQTVIQLEIRPQLRHVSTRTTEIYLRWLFEKIHLTSIFSSESANRVWEVSEK
ncbi:hypothetical protein [Comamonas sp. MYb396]|uniref:hypothetical protein n=1 Tax=Comamonas sp. MYb396 TaxID=2745302 RepID=UPI00309BEEFC